MHPNQAMDLDIEHLTSTTFGGRRFTRKQLIAKWKREAVDGMKESFNRKGKKNLSPDNEIKTLQAKIGELVVERDFLARAFDQ